MCLCVYECGACVSIVLCVSVCVSRCVCVCVCHCVYVVFGQCQLCVSHRESSEEDWGVLWDVSQRAERALDDLPALCSDRCPHRSLSAPSMSPSVCVCASACVYMYRGYVCVCVCV